MIYILNRYARLPFGHFWNSDFDIRKALRELKIGYTYLNPTANLGQTEDKTASSEKWQYKNIADGENFIGECLKFIVEDQKTSRSSNIKIFLPWVPMFTSTDLQKLSDFKTRKEISIFGLSMPTSDSTLGNIEKYRYYGQEMFENNSNFKLLWVGEIPVLRTDLNLKILQWVDFIDFKPAKPLRDHNKISFFGLLGQQRGIAEILLIALFNPQTSIEIQGYSYSKIRIFRPFKFKSLRYSNWKQKPWLAIPFSLLSLLIDLLRYLPNVTFSDKPFPNEAELSDAISMTGATFYHAKYSYGSGITMKSLNSGIPVIWIGIEGYAVKILMKHFPEGRINYHEVLIPGRISKKLRKISSLVPTSPYTWEDYVANLAILGD
jgi:hypothetical protein